MQWAMIAYKGPSHASYGDVMLPVLCRLHLLLSRALAGWLHAITAAMSTDAVSTRPLQLSHDTKVSCSAHSVTRMMYSCTREYDTRAALTYTITCLPPAAGVAVCARAIHQPLPGWHDGEFRVPCLPCHTWNNQPHAEDCHPANKHVSRQDVGDCSALACSCLDPALKHNHLGVHLRQPLACHSYVLLNMLSQHMLISSSVLQDITEEGTTYHLSESLYPHSILLSTDDYYAPIGELHASLAGTGLIGSNFCMHASVIATHWDAAIMLQSCR